MTDLVPPPDIFSEPDPLEMGRLTTFLAVGSDCGGGATLSSKQCRLALAMLQQQPPAPQPPSPSAPARRPKPSSLKKQALEELCLTADSNGVELSRTQVNLIRRALEALPND
jgi:hypothetical protein